MDAFQMVVIVGGIFIVLLQAKIYGLIMQKLNRIEQNQWNIEAKLGDALVQIDVANTTLPVILARVRSIE